MINSRSSLYKLYIVKECKVAFTTRRKRSLNALKKRAKNNIYCSAQQPIMKMKLY